MKKFFAIFLALALVCACEKDDLIVLPDGTIENNDDSSSETPTDTSSDDSSDDTGDDESDDSSESDDPQGGNDENASIIDDDQSGDSFSASDFPTTVTVTWDGSSATVSGADGVIDYSADGGYVTIGNSSSEVAGLNIVLKGSSSAGAFKLYNGKKTLVTMGGVTLTSKKNAAFNNQSKKRTFILLSSGTTNTLTDASSYTSLVSDEDCKGTMFSEGQLVFTGSGTLKVKGNCKHGIVSDDYIRITSGSVQVTGAASDGIHVKDYLRMDGGTLNVTASSDGIECDEGYVNLVGGSLTVNSASEGIKTSYDGTDISPYINIAGATVNVTTTGAKAHGIKAKGDVLISKGNITVNVSGKGSKAIKGNNNVAISGGTLNLKTTGASYYDTDDKDTSSPACIKAENAVTISGADITVTSTGTGGKGINCYTFTMDSGTLSATTTGSLYTYSSSMKCRPKAIKAMKLMTVNGGTITVKTSGTEAEGMESKAAMVVNGGYIAIQAYDDAINTATTYTQNGGYVYLYSTGNDALDSNYGRTGAIVMNKGVLIANGKTSPEMGIDSDNNSYITIKGGTIFTSGGQQGGGSSSPSCSQPTLWIQNTSLSAGYFTVTDSNGKVVFAAKVPRAISQDYSLVSSSSFKSGSTYKYGVVSSKPSSATTSWSDYYFEGGTVSGTLSSSFTATSGYQAVGTSSGGNQGGPGGR